eukprot:TRINITY_DN6976_c0_g1_i13.p1 TRINITY_DN6976_c0_g1~~TRINITY_DN6976_c0_g1_i13.p1  ORF type:complete len:341 (+),score=56.01 TRINITY_DN6976_c0_g1_i13:71-1093(+)
MPSLVGSEMCIRDRSTWGLYHFLTKMISKIAIQRYAHRTDFFRALLKNSCRLYSIKGKGSVKEPIIPVKGPADSKAEAEKMREEEMKKYISELEKHSNVTADKYEGVIKERIQILEEISKETKIPNSAFAALAIATLPIMAGSIGLNAMVITDFRPDLVPMLYSAYVKYAGLHLGFFSGMQMGLAISEHDCQIDPYESSPEVRRHFLLATTAVALSVFGAGALATGAIAASASSLMGYNALLIGIHIKLLLMDYRMINAKRAPKWMMKLKLIMSMLSMASLCGLFNIFQFYRDRIIPNETPYKQYVLNDQQAYNESIALQKNVPPPPSPPQPAADPKKKN